MTTCATINIGELAGQVWNSLDSNGNKPVSFTIIAKNTGLKKDQVALAAGWLAKEGKLNFEQKGATTKVSLIK